VFHAEDVLLASHSSRNVKFHLDLLQAEYEPVVEEIRSDLTSDEVVGRPNGRSLVLPFLADGAEVDGVNVNQALVVDCELEMVRNKLTGLSRSSVSDYYRLAWEAATATAIVAATSSTVGAATSLVVV